MRPLSCLLAVVVGVLSGVSSAHAQADAAAPAAAGAQCYPACRSGYLCHNGACVSECNPPCEAGLECRDRDCHTPAPPPAPPPSTWSDQRPVSEPPNPGAERHDGFMLRFSLGFGFSNTHAEAKGQPDEIDISGFSGTFSFDIGASLIDNLVLHARIADFYVLNKKYEVNGVEQTTDSSLAAFMFGPALSYYLMPANVYFTLALGLSLLGSNNGRAHGDSTDVGFGTNADVGKEWWVSDNWALGVAARFWFTHAPDSRAGVDITYNMFGGAVMFTATFN